MLVPFETLPEDARIWIYQSNRSLSEVEQSSISAALAEFLDQWKAHGQDLVSGFQIPYNRFIVIGLDTEQAAASGCSIDAQVHLIQSLEKQYEITLLDRMNVSFKSGAFIAYKPLKEFKKMVKDKSVTGETIVFNNLVNTKIELETAWEVPAKDSWHKHMF
ncbi:MAG: ABC transporter ATPase [Flavobacteriaceae bacterium]